MVKDFGVPSNAPYPMLFILAGIEINEREGHPLNANQSRLSIPSERTMRFTVVEDRAEPAIETTACPSMTDGMIILSPSVFIFVIVASIIWAIYSATRKKRKKAKKKIKT